jgi:hypothetical protein
MDGSNGNEHHKLHGILQWCDIFSTNWLTAPATARMRTTVLGNYYSPMSFFVTTFVAYAYVYACVFL